MPSLQEIKSQIQSLNGLEGFLGRREINELPNILWPNEIIAGIIQGTYSGGSGILVATDKRLIFIDKGLLFGLKVEDFSYDKISSVKYQTGLIMGELTILASGNNAVVKNVYNGKLRYFAETVRMIMSGDYSGRSSDSYTKPPAKKPQHVDVEFELEKIETHKELGILTEEEYEAARAKLGSRTTRSQNRTTSMVGGSIPAGFKWFCGIVFLIVGLTYSITESFTGILYIALGVFIIPPVSSHISWTRPTKYVAAIGGFIFILLVHDRSGSGSTAYTVPENNEFGEAVPTKAPETNVPAVRVKEEVSSKQNVERSLQDKPGSIEVKRKDIEGDAERPTKTYARKEMKVSQNWNLGGTLHDATIEEWKKASNKNKLATCADYALLLHPNFDDVDELKPYALAISVCIDEGTVDDLEMFKDLKVHEAASMCILLIKESRN